MHEAGLRLSHFSTQDSFTAVEFHELHLRGDLQDHGIEALKDPFWEGLILQKKASGVYTSPDALLIDVQEMGSSQSR
jgi:hypothetical protein